MQVPSKITIEFINHSHQRYETCGDYFYYPNGELLIRVSKLENKRMELLVAVHELVEAILTDDRGIKEEDISKFDMTFEKERLEGKHGDMECGDSPDAPYKNEHFMATTIERILASELKVDWNEYEQKLIDLYGHKQ